MRKPLLLGTIGGTLPVDSLFPTTLSNLLLRRFFLDCCLYVLDPTLVETAPATPEFPADPWLLVFFILLMIAAKFWLFLIVEVFKGLFCVV